MHARPHLHTIKPYLITSTTKVNAVKNFNLRSEKEGDIPISKVHLTSESERQKDDTQSDPWAGPLPCMLHACSTVAGADHTQWSPTQWFQTKDPKSCALPWSRTVLLMVLIGLWQFSQPCGFFPNCQSFLRHLMAFWGQRLLPMRLREALTHVRHVTKLRACPHYQEQEVQNVQGGYHHEENLHALE